MSHAAAGLTLAAPFRPRPTPRRYWVLAALCAAVPDVDLFWSRSVAEGGMFYHRGITHSFCFAALLGALAVWSGFQGGEWRGQRLRLWLAFSLVTASHGLLDAFSTYAGPIAYFAPFSSARFTSTWHPLGANDVRGPIVGRIEHLIGQELLFIWLPSTVIMALIIWVQRRRRRRA